MNLPVTEVAVQTLRGSRVCVKTPSAENSKVVPVRTTEVWQHDVMHNNDMHREIP